MAILEVVFIAFACILKVWYLSINSEADVGTKSVWRYRHTLNAAEVGEVACFICAGILATNSIMMVEFNIRLMCSLTNMVVAHWAFGTHHKKSKNKIIKYLNIYTYMYFCWIYIAHSVVAVWKGLPQSGSTIKPSVKPLFECGNTQGFQSLTRLAFPHIGNSLHEKQLAAMRSGCLVRSRSIYCLR